MPELPEIRTDAETLDFFLSGRIMVNIQHVTEKFKNKCKGLEELQEQLPLRVEKVISRAKKLFFHLVDPDGEKADWWIFLAYGMTGHMSLEQEKHSHIRFDMSHASIGIDKLFYSDTRRIGNFEASDDPEVYDYHINDMGKPITLGWEYEGFDAITEDEFVENVRNAGKKYLVAVIMDQRTVASGYGNYLVSECFHESKLDPDIRCNEMSEDDIRSFFKGSVKVIEQSHEMGGMSMADYVHIDGVIGKFQECLKVYGKKGEFIDGKEILSKKGKHGRMIFYVDHKQT